MAVLTQSRTADAQDEPVKPYIVFIMDVSGSMDTSTGSGPPSCGGEDTRLDHAKCALSNIVNTYGDVVIALARFRQSQNTGDTTCASCGENGINCGSSCPGSSCPAQYYNGDRLEVLVPLLDGNQNDIVAWNDLTCGTCTLTSSLNPELRADGDTPLAGSLNGAKRYMQGLNTPGIDTSVGTIPYWTGAGDDPIRDDPLKNVFLPGGEQCRPYIVILLTDGAETCSPSGQPSTAAGSLLVTNVDGQNYRIETKPIGFGISPGNAEIEAIARSGGNPGDGSGGLNEGFYAADETGLSIAISGIIADALKSELCNDLDDDCDIAVDEDFPLKGTTCDNGLMGICRGTGVRQCTSDFSGLECVITNPGQPVGTETCNSLDDDCDGKVDEAPANCTGCQPFELCDGRDNDCDGRFDEGITQPCGSSLGICTPGTRTCIEQGSQQPQGTWGPCSGTPPDPPERCNGLDDDCDGTVDGLQEQCVEILGNNPGVGICLPGVRTCPTTGTGWGPCIGEVGPQATDPCDGDDNDCDNSTDEDFVPSDCSSSCGMGQTECNNGSLSCNASTTPLPEVCNSADDDCDGLVDEMLPDMGPCLDDGRCTPGTLVCNASTAGQYVCMGGTLPGIEICDCEDNDCDGEIDEENPNPLCAPGASCVSCQCALPCDNSEFPCPVGRYCDNGFCLLDPCFNVTCSPDGNGDQTECVDGDCVRSCDLVTCSGTFVCRGSDGTCQPDNCLAFPDKCTAGELCLNGTCVADPCFGVDCSAGQYCLNGDCTGTCAGVQCPEGERCRLGACEPHPCGENCPVGDVCNETSGECESDPCTAVNCPQGEACDPQTGQCEDDPCFGVSCPGAGQVCVGGTCYEPGDLLPPDRGPPPEYVAPGGGAGCAAGSSPGGRTAAILLLLAIVAVMRRRRV